MKKKLLLPLFCTLFAMGFQSCDKVPEREMNTIESHLKTMKEYNASIEYPVEVKEIDSLFTAAKRDIKEEKDKFFKDFGKIKANLHYILRKQEKVIAESKENSQKATDAFIDLYADFLTVQKSLQELPPKDLHALIKEVGPELRDMMNGALNTFSIVPSKALTSVQKLAAFQAKDSVMVEIKEAMMKYINKENWEKYYKEAIRDIEEMKAQ